MIDKGSLKHHSVCNPTEPAKKNKKDEEEVEARFNNRTTQTRELVSQLKNDADTTKISQTSSHLSTVSAKCVAPNDAEDLNRKITDALTSDRIDEAKELIAQHTSQWLSTYKCRFKFYDKEYPRISPFALACRTGHLAIVQELYIRPEQLNESIECENGTNGRTPLMLAIMKGHTDVVEQLLKWGADPQVQDSDKFCAEEINFSFNFCNSGDKIKVLLKNHRKKNKLPEYVNQYDAVMFSNEGSGGALIKAECKTQ